jgi:hypothetical protein
MLTPSIEVEPSTQLMMQVHSHSLTMDNYYSVANEVLRVVVGAMLQKLERTDPRLVAFRHEVDAMFKHSSIKY